MTVSARFVRGLFAVITFVAFLPPARAQVGTWTAHTSMRQVSDVAASPEVLWAATTGGIFGFTPATGEFQRFTTVEGLNSVEVRAIAYDVARGLLWIGYQDGVLDRLDPATGEIRTFRDIARASQFPNRRINRLVVRGDSVLVATAFGLVVFDPVREEVRDTYSRLGDIPPATEVNDVTVAPMPGGETGLWLATERGVARASLRTSNLQDPAAWTVEDEGLPGFEPTTFAVAHFGGRLYVGTREGLYRRAEDGTFLSVAFSTTEIKTFEVVGDRLFGTSRFNLFVVEADGRARQLRIDAYQDPTDVVAGPDGNLWFGDVVGGLVGVAMPGASDTELEVVQGVVPEGPFEDQFVDLTIDVNGNLWAGGVGSQRSGFYRLDPEGRWTSYSSRFFEELDGMDRFTRVNSDPDGNAWIASENGGVVQVTPEGEVIVYDETNSSLLPTSLGNLIAGGVAAETDGTVWATTRGSARPLHVRTPDGAWRALPPLLGQGLTSAATAYGRVYVDAFDQKWIVVRNERNFNQKRGLVILDTGGTPTDPADDVFRFLDEKGGAGRGLPSPAVTAIAEDRSGLVWLGTESGPAFILNTGIVARDASSVPSWPTWADRARGTFVLFGLRINDIAVDPANRLWFATDQGAWLIEAAAEGGYDLVEQFTTENAPLFSDEILAVEVDGRTGRVYFATDRGLISFQGEAVAPAKEAGDLFVYPNPVVLTGGAAPDIFIEGLVEETEVRILAPHGALVARLSARGGRVRWDGRDLERRLVPSGVYIVVAVGQNDEGTAYGKIAVIR
ncbi:type IX secretion system anionic LPS delivery protein PorZ [Rhodocaloribacter sp.]